MKSKLSATKNPDRKTRGKKLEEPGSTVAKRVFIVEDHPVLRETLVRIVSFEKDLNVCGQTSAANGAFKAISRVRPDLVLVDFTLPGKSGLELVKELRAVDRKIKLLVVSMHDAAFYADRALQAGGNGYPYRSEWSYRANLFPGVSTCGSPSTAGSCSWLRLGRAPARLTLPCPSLHSVRSGA